MYMYTVHYTYCEHYLDTIYSMYILYTVCEMYIVYTIYT